MIDLNNPIFVAPNSPQAEWKRALIIDLANKFQLADFIETGTSRGDTVEAVWRYFNKVYSIELSEPLYIYASNRFIDTPNVGIFKGSSDYLLPYIFKYVAGPALIWLDAHYTGGESAGKDDDDYGPLANELKAIRNLSPKSLVLIDDCNPDFKSNPSFYEHAASDWIMEYRHGIVITHAGGYSIPEVL